MLKRLLLCSVMPLWMASANAQVPLIGGGGGAIVTCTNCTEQVTTLANNILVAANWVTQLERMTAQIQEQILIFQQLSGLTHVNGMAAALNAPAMFNQMNSFGHVPGLLQGAGGGIGAAYPGAALPVGGPPLMHAAAEIFNQRAASLASQQGMAAQMLENSNVILTGLMALQHLIDEQPSVQTMTAINGRLQTYSGNINTQQYQLSQMQAFAAAQDKVFEQKLQQAAFCSDAAMAAANPSLTGAGINIGAAHCAVGGPVAVAAGN